MLKQQLKIPSCIAVGIQTMDSLQALKNRKQGAVLAVALALLLIWRVLATIQVGISSVGLSLKV